MMNFISPSKAPRTSKPLKLILGVGVLAAVIGLGSTLAANIALNTGAPIEFGQGVAQTTSCDGQVTLTPISTFVNADGAGEFKFTGLTLSGLDTTDQAGPSEGCAGKSFTIKAYSETGDLLDPTYAITVGSAAFTSPAGVISNDTFGEDGAVTLTFDPTTTIAATDVYRITIESAVAEEVVIPVTNFCTELGATLDSQECSINSTVEINGTLTIPSGYTLILNGIYTITSGSGATIINNGIITVNGEIISLVPITNNGYFSINYIFNNGGGFYNTSTGTINNYNQFPNNNDLTNDGIINNYSAGYIWVFHALLGSTQCVTLNEGYMERISLCSV